MEHYTPSAEDWADFEAWCDEQEAIAEALAAEKKYEEKGY